MTVISGSKERKTFLIARTRPSRREIMTETLCQYATHNNSSPLDQAIIHWHLILRHVSRSHQSFSPQTRKFSSCLFIFKQHSIHHRPSGNQRRKKHCRSERTFFFIFISRRNNFSPTHDSTMMMMMMTMRKEAKRNHKLVYCCYNYYYAS